MAEAHEQMEHAEHAEHAAHSNKGIALLIAVLALFLALSETLGKSAQTNAISHNVAAADLWAFYQAKTIRMGQVQTAAELVAVAAPQASDAALQAARAKQIDAWKKEAARSDDDPGRNGRKQLTERAKQAEENRDTALAKYHHFEMSSAAFQIGIVLASASIITSMIALAWISGGIGIIGLIFMGIGLLAPHAVHLA